MKKITRIAFIVFSVFLISIIFLQFFIAPRIYSLISGMPSQIQKQLEQYHASYTPLSDINLYVQHAAIASQDERFYSNPGIDIKGTFRAIFFSITNGRRQGASTITEQLAKNLYFHDRDTLLTDIETKVLAVYITLNYSKGKVLEMYLNDIYYGRNAYGITSASRLYFHTAPKKITLAQSAFLIGIINAPSYLSLHAKAATTEAKIILFEMQRKHYITSAQKQKAVSSLETLKID